MEQIQAMEEKPLVVDDEGHFILGTDEGDFYISPPFSDGVLKMVGYEGMGTVAEDWVNGFCKTTVLMAEAGED